MAERQRFTIARDQAIAKMREYAMRHPDQYVLELIQAAVFRGARWISVDATPTETLVTWVGAAPVSRHELDTLFDYLFVDQARAETRALQQLALGVNALVFRKPRSLVIESGSGTAETTVRATVGRNGNIDVTSAEPLLGTYIRATFRKPGWRPWSTPAVPDERALIQQRCSHLPVPILVDGRPVLGSAPNTELWAPGLESSVSFNERGVRGVLGIVRPGVSPRVRIVVGGVTITTLSIPELGESTGGILCDDRLRKSADGVDIVQDDAWATLIRIAQPHIVPLLRGKHASVSTSAFAAPAVPSLSADATLVEPLRQSGLRPEVSVADLLSLPPSHPLFLVKSGSVIETHSALDPQRFPWPVLLLDEASGSLLSERLPDRVIARLQSAEDARFVAEMQRSTHPVIHSSRVTRDSATLWIRVHLDGHTPQPAPGTGTPLLHIVDGISRSLTRLPLELTGLWAFVEAQEQPPESLCTTLVIEALAMLLEEQHSAELMELKRAIVLQFTRPQLIATPGGTRLSLWLPPALQAHAPHLHALALTTGISAHSLAEVQGTASVLDVASADDLATLEPLERRLGWGHLNHPSRSQRRLFAAGTHNGHWIWLEPDDDWANDAVTNLLIVTACVAPDVTIDGFIVQDSQGPFMAHLIKEGATQHPPFAGIALLCRRLIELETHRQWPEDDADVYRSVARVVCLSQGQASTLPLRVGSRERRVQDVVNDERLRVATTHGPSHHTDWTTALTLDEATQLFADRVVPLGIDDKPEAWNDDPSAQVVHRPLHREWGHGWLSLPRPFDATLGILGVWQEQVSTLRGSEQALPCRGWVALTAEQPEALVDDLRFEVHCLYADLEAHVAEHPDDEDAVRYLKQWEHRRRTVRPLTPAQLRKHLALIAPCSVRLGHGPDTQLSAGALIGIELGRRDAARVIEPGGDLVVLWSLALRLCQATNTDFVIASERLSRSIITQTSE